MQAVTSKSGRLLLILGAVMIQAWAADPINQRCPVLTDEVIDPAITVVWQGKTIGLCCQRCKRQFLDKPGDYIANLPAMTGSEPLALHTTPAIAVIPAGHPPHDATSASSPPPRLIRWLGRFHPVVVHFPIALALAAAIAEVLHQLRGLPGARTAARFTIAGAALAVIPAALVGWFAASSGAHPGLESTLEWHRWLGTTAMVLLIASWGVLEVCHRHPIAGPRRFLPLFILVLTGLVVGLVGHLGGILVYGPEHFQWQH